MYGTPLRTRGVSSLVSNVGMFLLDGAVWFRYSSLKECATDVLSAGAARPAGYLSGDLLLCICALGELPSTISSERLAPPTLRSEL